MVLDKGDFIGREALAKIKKEGSKWKLCTFTIDADRPVMLRGSEPIMHMGRVIDITTSGGYGYTVGKTAAYSYIPVEDASYTEGYEIEVYMEVYPVNRHDNRALYDPERKKILM